MSLVPSLLQAIVQLDGEALVMHAGDKPYVVAPTGQVDLASRGLTLEAVNGIVAQLLPSDSERPRRVRRGSVRAAAGPEFPGEHFTVVAARGGDDVWVEIRRRRVVEEAPAAVEPFALPERIASVVAPPPAPVVIAPPVEPVMVAPVAMAPAALPEPTVTMSDSLAATTTTETSWSDVGDIYGTGATQPVHGDTMPLASDDDVDDTLDMPDAAQLWSAEPKREVPVDDDDDIAATSPARLKAAVRRGVDVASGSDSGRRRRRHTARCGADDGRKAGSRRRCGASLLRGSRHCRGNA